MPAAGEDRLARTLARVVLIHGVMRAVNAVATHSRKRRRASFPWTVCLLCVWLTPGGGLARGGTNASLFAVRDGWPCHVAEYAPRRLAWQPASAPAGLRAVYPHPLVAATVYAAAADGLHRRDDDGEAWRRLALEGLPDPTAITSLAFRPGRPETFAIGTRAQGVWLTEDGGQSARRIGARGAGMAADAVECLVFAPGDNLHRTLLAGHGRATPGVSRGDIRTGAWETVAPDYHVFRILPGDSRSRALYLFASRRTNPDSQDIYYAPVLGAYWQRLVADTLPADGAWLHARQAMYLATLDKGLLRCSNNGGTLQELGGSDLPWQSIGATWEANAEQERLGLYQPSRLGYVWTTNDLSATRDQGRGLPRGTLISENSRIVPGAGGTRCHALINGLLWIGRDPAPLRVDDIRFEPAAITVAGAAMRGDFWHSGEQFLRQFAQASRAGAMAVHAAATLRALNDAIPSPTVAVRARVTAPAGVAPRVTADLSRLGLDAATPLVAESNGLHTLTFAVTGEMLAHKAARRQGEWRPSWPGPLPVTVTAQTPDQKPAGAVALFGLYTRLEDFPFGRDTWALHLDGATGQVAFASERDDPRQYRVPLHQRLSVGPGAWCAPICHLNPGVSLADYEAVTFRLCSVGPADPDLLVHVRDRPADAAPTMSGGIAIVAGGHIAGGAITSVYRRVTIPTADLLRVGNGFNPELFAGIAFAGQSATNRTYKIDDLRLVVSLADLAAEKEESAP